MWLDQEFNALIWATGINGGMTVPKCPKNFQKFPNKEIYKVVKSGLSVQLFLSVKIFRGF